VQCTVHSPAVGTREYEPAVASGNFLKRLGSYELPESKFDGSHVVVVGGQAAWKRQTKLLAGYAAFYNPVNFVRALRRDGSPLRRRRIGYQAVGMLGTIWTAVKLTPYILRLMIGRPVYADEPKSTSTKVLHPAGAFRRWPVQERPLKNRQAVRRRDEMPA
jgi:hypothetical protein